MIEHIPVGNGVQKRNIEGIRQEQIVDILHYLTKNVQIQVMAANESQIDIRTRLVIKGTLTTTETYDSQRFTIWLTAAAEIPSRRADPA